MMLKEEYIKENFNKVDSFTAICRNNYCLSTGSEYPELEIDKIYHVTHIGVLKSSSYIMLSEFPDKEFNALCFDLFENGIPINCYTRDPRFMAPYLRKRYRKRAPLEIAKRIETIAIPAHLRDVEVRYNVKVLLAVESGSRAWGFESSNSDWDVRFIYVHRPEWYFKVEKQRDVIEYIYEDDVDLAGWELRKALSLLRRSNPSLLEWIHSPKVYYRDEEFLRRILEVAKDYFNPVKSMYHYNRMYNKHNERFLSREDSSMKRFLYYLRGVLACKWVEERKTLPPVNFNTLYEEMVADANIKSKIKSLIALKKEGKECDMSIVDHELKNYAETLSNYYNKIVGEFQAEQSRGLVEVLDSFLYDMVNNRQ